MPLMFKFVKPNTKKIIIAIVAQPVLFLVVFFLLQTFTYLIAEEVSKPNDFLKDITPEVILQYMEKEKESAIESGDTKKVEIIDARIRNFTTGSITREQILTDPYFGDKILMPETAIKILEGIKEKTTTSGDIEYADEIDSYIKAFRAGDIDAERLYAICAILQEKLKLGSGDIGPNSLTPEESFYKGDIPGEGHMMQQGMQGSSNMQKGSMTQGQQGMQGGSMMQGQQGNSMMQGGQQGAPQGSGGYSQQTGQPSGMSSPGGDMSKGGSMMQQGMQGSSNMQKGSMTQGQQGMQGSPQETDGYPSAPEESSYEGNIPEDALEK